MQPRRRSTLRAGLLAAVFLLSPAVDAQTRNPRATAITGRVLDAESGSPVADAVVFIEGSSATTRSDSAGRYRLTGPPPGPQFLQARRLGYAPARMPIVIPLIGEITADLPMSRTALRLRGVIVTADPSGRAEGELGTASVMNREAIANQTAASLAGILELTPGVPLAPPGLDGVQQIPLRSVPTSFSGDARNPGAGDLAAFGTLIVLDGVPVSNNANLQTTGPRGELRVSSSAGGGIDLRRIPATAIERVEVIRGIPSVRYGDLTQGAVIVDTRAGAVAPELLMRYDARSTEISLVGGRPFGQRQLLSGTLDVAHTRLAPGLRDDDALRITTTLAGRHALKRDTAQGASESGLLLDSRLSFWQLLQDNPEQPDVQPGRSSYSRDNGLRLSERLRFTGAGNRRVELSVSLDHTRQKSRTQSLVLRGAQPFTDRLDEGRAIGHFVGGEYPARVEIEGNPQLLYARLEGDLPGRMFGALHRVRAGYEFRREWTSGPGYQFDIEFPPQVSFNGVQGFDRPRRADAIPPLATSGLYLDDRILRTLPANMGLDIQTGVRLDMLHTGTTFVSGSRDLVVQPRLNAQLSPFTWMRLRGGAGRTAKLPSLGSLYPAPQYYDVINVNYYTNDPAERLAVLTTFIRNPLNPALGFSAARKLEAGFEVDFAGRQGTLAVTWFNDGTRGAVGFSSAPSTIVRDYYALSDSSPGSGRQPGIIEPPVATDTIPVIIDRPANTLDTRSSGVEATLQLPELRAIATRLEVQAAWLRTRVTSTDIDFGSSTRLYSFQLDSSQARLPYYPGATSGGERALITYRVVHHRPDLGLVVTGTIQHALRESRQNAGATDTLAFAGYLTRTGTLVAVPVERRLDPEFQDLRRSRTGLLTIPSSPRGDWLMSLQVSKTLPGNGRLAFFAFNAVDRVGRYAVLGRDARLYPALRYGVEGTLLLAGLKSWR